MADMNIQIKQVKHKEHSRKSIGIIGRTAEGTELLDGQTVKTKVLCQALRETFQDRQLSIVDTYDYKHRGFRILWQLLRTFVVSDDIFVLLARNGRTFFFPLITGLNKLFRRRLYHDVVGGSLAEEAAKSKMLQRQLRCFDVNWVELPQMKERLAALGIGNAEVLPNFKYLNTLNPDELERGQTDPFAFVMFSRVVESKGMGLAAQAIAEINREAECRQAILRIWGPIEDSYKEQFDRLLLQYQECVSYEGTIPYSESVQTLKGAFMLLFPSTYPGEGMPGTIIDAFSAGLPVIASDWHFNREFVREGETGYCYRWDCPEQLKEKILYAMDHSEDIWNMKVRCLQEVEKYKPSYGMKIITDKMEMLKNGGGNK